MKKRRRADKQREKPTTGAGFLETESRVSVISAGTRALESVTNRRTGATVSDERSGENSHVHTSNSELC